MFSFMAAGGGLVDPKEAAADKQTGFVRMPGWGDQTLQGWSEDDAATLPYHGMRPSMIGVRREARSRLSDLLPRHLGTPATGAHEGRVGRV